MDTKKISNEIIVASQTKLVTNDDLSKSCFSLMKYKKGLFSSEKQGKFFKYQISKGQKYNGNLKIDSDDIGIISSSIKKSMDFQSRFLFVIDTKGVREYYTEWWKLSGGMSRSQAEREMKSSWARMSPKHREQNEGLQEEEIERLMEGEWRYGGTKKKWTRS